MIFVRSAIFNLLFYVNLIILMVLGLPAMLFGRHAIFWLARFWARSSLWLLKIICATDVEFRGIDRIPPDGLIVAAKHQSVWETFALLLHFNDFSFILKRELTWIPFFGWYILRAEQIAINRSSGRAALNEVTERAKELTSKGRQLFIFPEGTRRPPGAEPTYKYGVAFVYSATGVPCLPVALNSGMYWPRRTFIRRPGKILVEFLEPIQPGLTRDAFFELLQSRLETATNGLISEALEADPSLLSKLDRDFAPTKSVRTK